MQTFAKLRVVMSFVLAPIVAALAINSPFLIEGQSPRIFVTDALINAAIMFLGAVFIGLPIFLVASAKGWLRLIHAVLAGFSTGALFSLLLGGGLRYALVFGFSGAIAGAIFWFMALFRNPLYPRAKREAK